MSEERLNTFNLMSTNYRECDDCPWAYSFGYTEEWGCVLFGKECEKCKKFDSDVGGCFYSQKKLERLAYEFKKRCRHAQKIAEGYNPFFKKPKTEKTPIFRPHFGFEYKVVGHKTMFCKNYIPNLKGGHTHNHLRNTLERKLNKSKSSRKRCHNVLNKGYEYKFNGQRMTRVK